MGQAGVGRGRGVHASTAREQGCSCMWAQRQMLWHSHSRTSAGRTCSTSVPMVICPGWLCCVRQSDKTLTTMLVLLMATRAPTNAPCHCAGRDAGAGSVRRLLSMFVCHAVA